MASRFRTETEVMVDDGSRQNIKRRRLSPDPDPAFDLQSDTWTIQETEEATTSGPTERGERETNGEETSNIRISSTSKQAGETVAPFLARHIPDQYNPLGSQKQVENPAKVDPNTRYCYRHRPDLKCRRQADEPTMGQLQRELETLSQADQQGIAHVWSLFSAAPSKHRNLMLQGILTQCCFPQLSYLSGAVRELIRIDFLSALPPEISFKILCFLDTTSLCKAAQVSQRWRSLADDDVVWHRMCEQHIDRKCTKCGWGLPLLERKRLRATKRQIQLRATGMGLNQWSPAITPLPEISARSPTHSMEDPGERSPINVNGKRCLKTTDDLRRSAEDSDTGNSVALRRTDSDSYFKPRLRPWKDVYKDRFKVGTNWKYGRCSTRIFKGHSNGVMCLQFDEQILATGSYDSTIKIWDIETGDEIRTLRGHQLGIRCLQFDDTKLISGSIDRTIKVWNWRTGECISTYTGHGGAVISLHFDASLLASGSVDKTIKIWNFEDKSTFMLRGHAEWVNSVKVDSASRTVFSASDDCTVRLWDLDTKFCIKVFEGHVGPIQQVLPLPAEFELEEEIDPKPDSSQGRNDAFVNTVCDGIESSSPFGPSFGDGRPDPPKYMLTGSLDGTIRLWNVHSGECLRTFFGHVEGIWALAADTLRVVSGAEDRMVKVWDTRTGKCERTFTGHAGPVTCIGLSDSRMCTGSEDCEVRMYSFKPDATPTTHFSPPSISGHE